MEIIIYSSAVLLSLFGIFLIIEYPYHFIGIYIFFTFYQFNIQLPGPLDLRGLISLILFFRLIVFDKENLDYIIKYLFTNYLFIIILFFDIYFISITYVNSQIYKTPIRLFIYQLIGVIVGFLAVYRGYVMKTFGIAIFITGIIATMDLIYSFGLTSQLFVRRVLDVIIKSEYATDLNHNSFGMMNSIALVCTYVMFVAKKMDKKKTIILLLVFGTGVFLSTSRTSLLTSFASIIIATLLFPRDSIDVKKIFIIGMKGFIFLLIILGSFILILNILNVNSTFTDKIYYRLVEEPESLMEGKTSKFRGDSQFLKEGSASWRINKAIRDYSKFTDLDFSVQFLGFGYNGYSNIGEKDFDRYDQIRQKPSHNGLIDLLVNRGIFGFILFFIINFLLIKESLKVFKENILTFPFFVIIIFMLIYTFGAAPLILDRFGYIIMGGVIGQVLYHQHFGLDNSIELNR